MGTAVGLHKPITDVWLSKWRGAKIFVLGDVMLDKFVQGRVERISPEAPIPVLQHQSERAMPGGAANVARNVVALGGAAILAGIVGDDDDGVLLSGLLTDREGVEGRLVRARNHPTTTKTRFLSGGQQIMRLDVERRFELAPGDIDALCAALDEAVAGVSAIVLSDYAKGVVAPELIRRVIEIARRHSTPVVVDPKSHDVGRYAGATVLTPNASEAATVAGVEGLDDAQAEKAARIVYSRAKVGAVVLTRGAQGMTIFDPSDPDGDVTHVPARATEVFDVSGAGDTVVAALALALGAGADVKTAARLGNAAAGIAVRKRGTAVVQARELAVALGGSRDNDPKIADNATVADIVADWKAHGLRVGFTNGCFDLLHPGHIELLKEARACCDRLVVALNSDASVRRLKGDSRPVQNERARSVVIAAIDSVDLVTLFDDDTPMRLLQLLMPDRLIKGADYTIASVVGADFVQSYGGKVVLAPIERGYSTTSLIARAGAGAA